MFIVGVIMLGAIALGFVAVLLLGAHFELRRKSRAWSIVMLVLAIIVALPVVAFVGFILFNIVMEILSKIS